MIKVNNEKELLKLLRIVSSEAVSLSKRKLSENKDPSTREYSYQKKMDEKLYGSLSEQEEELEGDAPEGDAPEGDAPEGEIPEEEPELDAEQEAEPSEEPEETPEEETGTVGASFDSVVKAVNNLRAGKSLRDSSIKQQAQNYYDKLSEPERTTLLVFLQAISDIIAGQIDGKDAQDPSDPPVSLNISSGEDEKSAQPEQESMPQEQEPDDSQEAEVMPDEEEDTSPPIRVNESQDLTTLRKKVRRMMLRG